MNQRIARQGDDGTGAVEYARGLDALASREYLAAATAFADGDRRGFHGVTLRPLLAYALCKAGHADAVKPLAARADLCGVVYESMAMHRVVSLADGS